MLGAFGTSARVADVTEDAEETVHNHPHCPGDDWIGCHDQSIYGPCESDYCYGADTYFEICTCECHERETTS